jgi:hypothetical protein
MTRRSLSPYQRGAAGRQKAGGVTKPIINKASMSESGCLGTVSFPLRKNIAFDRKRCELGEALGS